MVVPYMLSVYDLRKYTDEWHKEWEHEQSIKLMIHDHIFPKKLLVLLYTLGMDITKKNDYGKIDISLGLHLHRSLSGKVVKDWHFNGFERTDNTWKRSGYASQEAILFTKDDSLVKELKRMSGEYDVNSEFKKTKRNKKKEK